MQPGGVERPAAPGHRGPLARASEALPGADPGRRDRGTLASGTGEGVSWGSGSGLLLGQVRKGPTLDSACLGRGRLLCLSAPCQVGWARPRQRLHPRVWVTPMSSCESVNRSL